MTATVSAPPELQRIDGHDGHRRVVVDGIPIDALDFEATVRLMAQWAAEGSGGYVCTPNVDHIVKARRLPAFRAALLGARLRVPDGMGLVYGSWIAGTPIRSRVTGRRLPAAVGARLGQAGLGIALVSWRPSVLARAARRLEASGSRVAAAVTVTTDPADGSVIDESVVEALRRSEARAVFAAVGSPEQEVWMATHAPRVPYALFAGVGSAVDVLGGRVREAPAWMTSVGLEWFFRLAQEPQRLAGRYLRDDPPFFVWMLRERVRRRSTRGDRAR